MAIAHVCFKSARFGNLQMSGPMPRRVAQGVLGNATWPFRVVLVVKNDAYGIRSYAGGPVSSAGRRLSRPAKASLAQRRRAHGNFVADLARRGFRFAVLQACRLFALSVDFIVKRNEQARANQKVASRSSMGRGASYSPAVCLRYIPAYLRMGAFR